MAEEKCGFCEEHSLRALKIEQNCKAIESLKRDHHDLEQVLNGPQGIITKLALIEQKVDKIAVDGAKAADVEPLKKIVWGLVVTALGLIVKEVVTGRVPQ